MFALAVVLSLLVAPTTARAQGGDSETAIDTVVVTAQREAVRQAIVTFVSNVTRWDGENVARWRDPVCPSVSGATHEQGEFIRARILAISAATGAPLGDNEKCEANLLVILTAEPDELWTTWRARHPAMFAEESRQNIERSLDADRPVLVWQNLILNNADGTRPGTAYRHIDSRIRSSVAEGIFSVVAVVDTTAMGGATLGQLADYVSMVSLARIDPEADFGSAATILRLFTKSSEGAPSRLTNWDQAFLKSLYTGRDAWVQQRSFIMTRMREELAP
jgi:hypothetical protein